MTSLFWFYKTREQLNSKLYIRDNLQFWGEECITIGHDSLFSLIPHEAAWLESVFNVC